jgi:hypothetical protein
MLYVWSALSRGHRLGPEFSRLSRLNLRNTAIFIMVSS